VLIDQPISVQLTARQWVYLLAWMNGRSRLREGSTLNEIVRTIAKQLGDD
jgi:hypothetical protein